MADSSKIGQLEYVLITAISFEKRSIYMKLLCPCDILFLQEIIVLIDDSDFIFKISDEFDAIVLPSKCPMSECFEGRS